MNKDKFVKELMNKTNYSEEQCEEINEIVENNLFTLKNKKSKIINDFINMGFSIDESNNLYNTCISILESSLKNKLKNPFSFKN